MLTDGLEAPESLVYYSKTWPNRPLNTNYRLMQVKSIAECSKGSIQQYFWPSLIYHLSSRYLCFDYFEWPLRTGLLYMLTISLRIRWAKNWNRHLLNKLEGWCTLHSMTRQGSREVPGFFASCFWNSRIGEFLKKKILRQQLRYLYLSLYEIVLPRIKLKFYF